MWRSYFQVFFRNLLQQKTIAVINVLGLALGLCAFLMIGVYVRDEYSYESRWQNSGRIVRLVNHFTLRDGNTVTLANVTELAGPLVEEFFPDAIERSARLTFVPGETVSVDGAIQEMLLYQADPELLDIFNFEVLEGDLREAFAEPNRIALIEEDARRLFGNASALGKVLTWQEPATSYEVVAVYRAPPGKGPIEFSSMTLWTETGAELQAEEDWMGGTHSYFLLREGIGPSALAAGLDSFANQRVRPPMPIPEGSTTADFFKYRFQDIRDMHFVPNSDEQGGSRTTVNTLGAIALLILAIGWSNFVILALARSVERQREVGIRKMAGATGSYLLGQFVGEAMLLSLVALVLALVLLEFTLPVFAALMQTTLSIDLLDGQTLAALAALLLITGSIGGIYPALVLARQKPELVLKPGDHGSAIGTGLLRKALVSMQFLIATALIIATLVMYLQLAYLRQRDPGFNTANVVSLALGDIESPSEVAVLRNAIAAIPGVERIALSSDAPGMPGTLFLRPLQREGDAGSRIEARNYTVDYDFFAIYGMDLVAGRGYDRAQEGPGQAALATRPRARFQSGRERIVLNEASVRALGFPSPAEAIGQTVETPTLGGDGEEIYEPAEIIGVIANSQFGSVRLVPGNEVYTLNSFASWNFTLKVDAAAMATIATELQRAWQELRPFRTAEIAFIDNHVRQAFILEQNTGRLLSGFALLAILVACMGLYGVVAFETRRRKKEISIRSVLGGELRNILTLFLARFAGPVFWTNAFAWPLALWFMLRWLEQFPYRIDNWWLLPVCVAAGALVLSIVALTVGATVIKALESKPADALRYE